MSFVPYKVDHSIQNTAKTLGFSKKRVNFKFGFANTEAVDRGEGGAACRGSEHEIVFVWSLKTGKRQLFVDGKDVHFSESGMNGWTVDRTWQHSFPLLDKATGQSYKIHFISQVATPDIPDSHPFDLRINGVSYFRFNEIWKLGTPQMVTRQLNSSYGGRSGRSGGGYRRDNSTEGLSAEEQRQIAQAKLESLKDFERQKAKEAATPAPAAGSDDLLSFDAPPPAQVMVPNQDQQPAFPGAAAPAPPAQQPYGGGAYNGALVPAPADPYAAAPAPYPGAPPAPATTQMAPYTGAPAPYGGMQAPAAGAPVYGQQAPAAYGAAPAAYGIPPSTPTYAGQQQAPPPTGAGGAPFTSPTNSVYTYGSAPAFAKPAAQEQAPGMQQQAPAGYPAFATPPAGQQPPPPQQQNPFGGF